MYDPVSEYREYEGTGFAGDMLGTARNILENEKDCSKIDAAVLMESAGKKTLKTMERVMDNEQLLAMLEQLGSGWFLIFPQCIQSRRRRLHGIPLLKN